MVTCALPLAIPCPAQIDKAGKARSRRDRRSRPGMPFARYWRHLRFSAKSFPDQSFELARIEMKDPRDQAEHKDVLALVLGRAAERFDGQAGNRHADMNELLVVGVRLDVVGIVKQDAALREGNRCGPRSCAGKTRQGSPPRRPRRAPRPSRCEPERSTARPKSSPGSSCRS